MKEKLRFPEEADIITERILNENQDRLIKLQTFYLVDKSGVALRITDVNLPEKHPEHVLYCGFIPDNQTTLNLTDDSE